MISRWEKEMAWVAGLRMERELGLKLEWNVIRMLERYNEWNLDWIKTNIGKEDGKLSRCFGRGRIECSALKVHGDHQQKIGNEWLAKA